MDGWFSNQGYSDARQKKTVSLGVTFEMFNGTSIDVVASDTVRLTLMDVVWKVSYTESSRSDTFHRLAGLMHSFRAIELFQ